MTFPTALLMLKAPVEGTVKTRLGREIGVHAATHAYRALVAHQLRQIPPGWTVQVCYAPAPALRIMQAWLGDRPGYSAQANGDLGERLWAATTEHFRRTPAPVIILGGDCPYLDTGRLIEAAEALLKTDAVVVPALDGGYCLIGLRRQVGDDFFQCISWSTEKVMKETRQKLRERGLTWTELEPAEDVDDLASWARARRWFPHLDKKER